MKSVVKYCIVEEFDPRDLEHGVNSLLSNGWKLQGGVSISFICEGSMEYVIKYCQALSFECEGA